MIKIDQLNNERVNDFLEYVTIHLSENGINETPLFQPLTKKQSNLSDEWKERFENGLKKDINNSGWRKLWIATNQENKIVGHVDIRSHSESNTEHRVLLGMGVDSNFRNLKIGQKLIEFIITYCKNNRIICWIDLQVLTNNIPAIKLYKKMNFKVQSNIFDMFRIDNISYDYTSMTLNVETK